MKNNQHIVIFRTDDGKISVDARFTEETVWLSLDQLATLFERDKSTISRHIKNVFEDGELLEEATVAKFATVQNEGDRSVERQIEFYNLDVIISVHPAGAYSGNKRDDTPFEISDPGIGTYYRDRILSGGHRRWDPYLSGVSGMAQNSSAERNINMVSIKNPSR